MQLKRIKGMIESNCYIISNNEEGVIIDPGAESSEILDAVKKDGSKIKYIILTHVHFDHMVSVDEVKHSTGAKVVIHESEKSYMKDSLYNGAQLFGVNNSFEDADVLVKDGDRLEACGLAFEIIHTPGHSPGGICIKVGNSLFSGDTLFFRSIGRSDLGNGNSEDLISSIKNKLFKLNDNVDVYPGHGAYSTIGYEKKNNPYVKIVGV